MSLLSRLEGRVRQRVKPIRQRDTGREITRTMMSNLVEGQDYIFEESRIKPGYIHVSSLLDFCPRKWVLAWRHDRTPMKSPRAADRVVWAMGRAAEAHVRGQFIASVGGAGVYGIWKCLCGANEEVGFLPANQVCTRCNNLIDRYHELPAVDEELMVIGNPDLLFFASQKMVVAEIKSINKKEFDLLTEPKPNHIFQASAYHRILSLSRQDLHPEVIVFYVCKDYSWKSPYKEFHVPADRLGNIVNSAFDRVRDFRRVETSGVMPERLEACGDHTSILAKNCEMCVECFSR